MRPKPPHALLAAACAVLLLAGGAALVAAAPTAHATVPEPTTPVTGNSTYFDALGSPYGGCGLPQSELDSQNFVALNVYDTPGDYAFYPRPIPPAQADLIGIWNNGQNCGRWVRVTIGDFCTGVNDGAPGQPFCRNGSWVADSFNGATLDMIVADSCGDANAWCRDDPYHLDLAKPALDRFARDGAPVGSLLPNNFNNRRVSWNFIPAPSYSGDITIGFLQGAQRWWPAISVSHLANGVHGVEYRADGVWRAATMNADMGQSYVIGGTTNGGTDFEIRVRDARDALINDGRIYRFSLPAACASQCSAAYTRISYTTGTGGTTGPTAGPTTPAATTPPVTTPPPAGAACAAAFTVTGQWNGAFQADVTVRNTGDTRLSGWEVGWTLATGQRITQFWNAVISTTGTAVTAGNMSWNGALPAGTSTTFGLITGSDSPAAVPALTCRAV
jgi:hypothetical protein